MLTSVAIGRMLPTNTSTKSTMTTTVLLLLLTIIIKVIVVIIRQFISHDNMMRVTARRHFKTVNVCVCV